MFNRRLKADLEGVIKKNAELMGTVSELKQRVHSLEESARATDSTLGALWEFTEKLGWSRERVPARTDWVMKESK